MTTNDITMMMAVQAEACAGEKPGDFFVRWLLALGDEGVLRRLDDAVRYVTGAVLRSDDARGEVVLRLGFEKRWERRVEVCPSVVRVVRVEAKRRRMMWTDGVDVFEADPAQELLELGGC